MRPWSCQVFGAGVYEVSGSIIVSNLSLMLTLSDPPQCYNTTGHFVDSRAEDLTAPWTHGMTSTQCMHKSKSQVYNAALGSTRYVSGGTVGNIDLTYPWQHGIERCNEYSQVHVVPSIETEGVTEQIPKPQALLSPHPPP